MSSRIEDYALIGDLQTAALVGRNGSIDWLCFPRFDSGACFASLLGKPENGRWLLGPAEDVRSIKRHYTQGTLILETDIETENGAAKIIDFMPLRTTHPAVVRIVVGTRGQVRMRTSLTIRFDYGSVVPWVRKRKQGGGILATAGPDTVYFRTDVPLRGENLHTVGDFTLSEGERIGFELAWFPTHEPEPPQIDPEQALAETHQWWREWCERCTFKGEWHEAVLRSLITLKALTYTPTGGIVAAPTTSLPEQIGSVRNWDYRYCWLRDATFTLFALTAGGYTEEAQAWRSWLVNAVAGTPSELQIMYGLAGERRLTELELPWLPGYEESKPVRIGNAAYQQRQLDVYGEIMAALFAARRLGIPASAEAWRIQQAILGFLETAWRDPDDGIWEVRGPKRQFTHSKVMAWVAFDRAVKTVEQFGEKGDVAKWRQARDEIRAQVLAEGFNRDVNAFTQSYGSKDADASLLLLPLVHFIDARDPRMVGTVQLIQNQLLHDGFVRRYPTKENIDGLPPGEGAFLLCTFWLADNLALQGRVGESRRMFERLLSLRNDVGLLAEEYDPAARRFLGNFPQAFSHVGLINSARNLNAAMGDANFATDKEPDR